MSVTVTRNAFKLYVSCESDFVPSTAMMQSIVGYPVDNVIQIKLKSSDFKLLFNQWAESGQSTSADTTSLTGRINAPALLTALRTFFSSQLNNYNNLASDVTDLVANTYNDVEINPVLLESACKADPQNASSDGAIFKYFFESNAFMNGLPVTDSSSDVDYGALDAADSSSDGKTYLRVYEVIAREIDNMISRNLMESTSINPAYNELDVLFEAENDAFWKNLQEGDSIFIEGSFNVPTNIKSPTWTLPNDSTSYSPVGNGNLPIILQFVNSNVATYSM